MKDLLKKDALKITKQTHKQKLDLKTMSLCRDVQPFYCCQSHCSVSFNY